MGDTWFEIEVGCLLWSKIREIVEEERFKGHYIDCHESKGWFSRKFIIKGDEESLIEVRIRIDRLMRSMGDL